MTAWSEKKAKILTNVEIEPSENRKVLVSYAAFFIALIPVFGVASAIVLIGEHPSAI